MFPLKPLQNLPLHPNTIRLIEARIIGDSTKQKYVTPLYRLIYQYETSRTVTAKNKTIERIIYETYFHWLNEIPAHLQSFQKRSDEIYRNWPVEKDFTLKQNANMSPLREAWIKNKAEAIPMTLEYMVSRNPDCPVMLFEPIFEQFHYLMCHPELHHRKIRKSSRIPLLLVPMNVLGQDIPDSRIRNLLKGKINDVYNLLAIDNPVLSTDVAVQLLSILNKDHATTTIDSTIQRHIIRRYKTACQFSYISNLSDNKLSFEQVM